MTVKSDLIASLVQQEFDRLPAKRKPVVRDNGLREWVPLSGIVAEGKDGKLTCLSLATGMKCLPASKLPQAQGNVLHDWHAEVLAIRAFNCFVLDECYALASGSRDSSDFIRRRSHDEMSATADLDKRHRGSIDWHGQPFAWRDDVLLHMYCSEAPCGDASMELTMASQADATPWAIPTTEQHEIPPSPSLAAPTQAFPATDTPLPGRAYFSQLGIVRRKPSRGDAPPTLSKSCSDKLSLHQCTSLLSSVVSLLVSVDDAYLSTLILPTSQYSAAGCHRAFSDGRSPDAADNASVQTARMAPFAIQTQPPSGQGRYAFRPLSVETTDLEFAFSRRSAAAAAAPPCPSPALPPPSHPTRGPAIKRTPSNLSTALTASARLETTLNGVLQGRKASDAHPRGASFASRRRLWGLAVEVANLLAEAADGTGGWYGREIRQALGASAAEEEEEEEEEEERGESVTAKKKKTTYADVKNTPLLLARRRAKEEARRLALKGWVRNAGDEGFVL
ncbi:adenosine deaminase/editase [Nemania diffusa]|nr:adenosine deaminase/editase [Nemania diffusa]